MGAGEKSDTIFKRDLKTPAQLEKLVSKDSKEIVERYTIKPRGDRKIALMEDNRPAVATSKEKFSNG